MQLKGKNFRAKSVDLQNYSEWEDAFGNKMKSLQIVAIGAIGAIFNNNPEDYYFEFNPDYFDQIIYFDNTTASTPLF